MPIRAGLPVVLGVALLAGGCRTRIEPSAVEPNADDARQEMMLSYYQMWMQKYSVRKSLEREAKELSRRMDDPKSDRPSLADRVDQMMEQMDDYALQMMNLDEESMKKFGCECISLVSRMDRSHQEAAHAIESKLSPGKDN